MLLDFLEKREETIDTTELTDEEKLFLKVFGIEENQPVAAMREITYFTCIKKIAEAVAKTPLYLVQDTENGIRRATEDPLNELLSLRPNPYMTAVDFWKAIEATRQHDGISAAVKQYGRKGELLALYPCTIEGMTIDDAGLLKSKLRNKILIEYRVTGSSTTDYGFYEDLLIFKGFTMDGINTKPVRELVKSTIEGQIKAQNYLNNLYDNGLTNKMVVQLTSDIKDEKELGKIQAKFGRLYSKGKRIFTVPAGFSVQPVNLSLADAQYEQIRRMSISQIAALFGVKMHQLNDLKDTNNNSLEQQQLNFLVDTLLILYESIEQEVTWSALTKEKRAEGYKARFNTKDDNYNLDKDKRILQKRFMAAYLISELGFHRTCPSNELLQSYYEQAEKEAEILAEFSSLNEALLYAKNHPVELQLFVKSIEDFSFHEDTLSGRDRLTIMGYEKEDELLAQLDYLWNYAVQRKKKNSTVWIFVDSVDELIYSTTGSDYLISLLERADVLKTPITLVVEDAVHIVTNQRAVIEFEYLLDKIRCFRLFSLNPVERKKFVEKLNISRQLIPYFVDRSAGEGVLITPSFSVAFNDRFADKEDEFYRLFV